MCTRSRASQIQAVIKAGLFGAGLLLVPQWSYALLDPVNREWFSTARALTMGNAGIATAEDATTAMFYNPAALSSNRKLSAEVFNPQFDVGVNSLTIVGGVDKVGKAIDLSKIQPQLEANPDKSVFVGMGLFPHLAAKNFAFGILAKAEGGAYMNTQRELRYRYQQIFMPTAGFSLGLLSGYLKLGVAVRLIHLVEVNRKAPDLGTLSYRQGAGEGMGIAADFGSLLVLPVDWLPTFAFVGRNIGGADLTGAPLVKLLPDNSPAPAVTEMSFDFGFSASPKLSQTTVLKSSIEFRDFTNVSETVAARKINLGFELSMRRYLFLRFGVSQGYWSAGFGLSGRSGSLDFGTHGKELEPRNFRGTEERRIVMRYAVGF